MCSDAMTPRVFIPYREDSPARASNRESALKFFAALGYSVTLIDTNPSRPFNRGEARNSAVDLALKDSTDPIVICDVDCLPDPIALNHALNGCEVDGGLHYPFTRVRMNWADGSQELQTGHDGGCVVVRPSEWRSVLGCPELYAYGWEDKILLVRYRTWVGPECRWDGILNHLYHPQMEHLGTAAASRHLQLCRRYEAVCWNQWELWELECSDALWDFTAALDGSRRSRLGW